MMKREFNNSLKRSVKGKIYFSRRLEDYTTFKIGGMPRVWIEPSSTGDLKDTARICDKFKIRLFIIGGGSNILVSDGDLDLAVIRLAAPHFKRIKFYEDHVICGSGNSLSAVIKKCVEKGLSGLERFAGIPGTVGGAIMMNSGTGNNSVLGPIRWVKVLDKRGRTNIISSDRLKPSYRNSGLAGNIILEVCFNLRRRKKAEMRKEFRDRLNRKIMTQEYAYPSAGCVFTNPAGLEMTSGEIIDRCGLKGFRIGNAEISGKHANFIINTGGASFSDVKALMRLAKSSAKEKYGIKLEREIKIVK